MAGELDLDNRDPNNINDHLKVCFEDILAEPEGIHSPNCVWSNAYTCFNCCKKLCYTIMTLCCGICIAAEWGCEFAYIAFGHIWYVTPCFKCLELNCGCCQKLYGMCIHCVLDPPCEAISNFQRFQEISGDILITLYVMNDMNIIFLLTSSPRIYGTACSLQHTQQCQYRFRTTTISYGYKAD